MLQYLLIKNSRKVKVLGPLRDELMHWRFLDTWTGYSKWRSEFHKVIELSTDSSGFRYGASVTLEASTMTLGDYWDTNDCRPIHEKEAEAVMKSLQSIDSSLQDSRVDLFTDNMAVIAAWENQGRKSRALSCIMKEIFSHVSTYNIDLHLKYVPSCLNEADAPSRLTNTADSMLSEESWLLVESLYGPHSVDLMSLDSNVMKSSTGVPLKHFTPWPTPCSAGVNLFSQNLRSEQNPYVYPPFVLVFPVLSLLREQGISCTIIVPEMRPLPIWWPILKYYSVESVCLGPTHTRSLLLYIYKMRTMMMYSSFLLICLFALSEQCGCPVTYTQQIICGSPIVFEAKIESTPRSSVLNWDKNYQISVTKFYKGKEEFDTLSDKTTLKTPKETSACGPVVLTVGASYILSVSVYDGKMSHNLCGFQVDTSSATNTLLEGLAGKYQENCDCEIPSMYDPPQFGPRSNKQCGHSSCSGWDTVCARDSNVVELKIESYSENAYDRNYQISATKFYKGKGKYDTLANKTTLETPKDFTVCGPVDLEVGSSYILSVSIHNGKMHNNDCDLKVEASKATNTMLEGLAGKYEENCDCDIPTYFDGPIMFRSKKQCGTSYCDTRDVICARDDNDQCNWSNC
ncbi:unnamed protein product [Mytilus edulis]|uniref:Uncharacterized protein n=1 Tax=Mytilus edulis TaxID=6550 RepID=A0A8S3QVU4_MYTED|nr:unnamed protein product [Mytilus edulis]